MGQIWARHVPVSLDIWEDEKDEMCSGKIAQREGGGRLACQGLDTEEGLDSVRSQDTPGALSN